MHQTTMAVVEIPVELITEILTRLPVKPLTRFKCVSKAWNSLISSPYFITHHFKSNHNPKIICISYPYRSLFFALIDDNRNSKLHFYELNHPLELLPTRLVGRISIINSCNGILLISDSAKNTMFLYNPANNTYRLLPAIPTQRLNDKIIGFGYDSYTDDYKVIRVFQAPDECVETCVYTMRENVWKLVKDESVSVRKHLIKTDHTVSANGVLYFWASTMEFKWVVMCFDVRTEAFSILDYPESECYDFRKVWISFSELRGCLFLLVNYRSEAVRVADQLSKLKFVDVWEMREASWVKLFRIRNSEVVGKGKPCLYIGLVAYSKDKEKVLLEVDGALFGWYDLVTKSVKRVETDPPYRAVYPMTYIMESLVSVSNHKVSSVSKGGSTLKKTVNKWKNTVGFLSKRFKLRL